MHSEIVDRYFIVFFVEIKLKKESLKNDFWDPKLFYWSLKQPEYTQTYKVFLLENSFSLPLLSLSLYLGDNVHS